jgi:hypothetical protein
MYNMKKLIFILLVLVGFVAKAQLPSSTFPSRIFNGNTKAQWLLLDSPAVNPILDTFYARYPGTQIVRIQGGDTSFWFYGGNRRWFRSLQAPDTISLSNRINLKLNISDTTSKWWNIGKRWVDTVYRVNDSTIGFTINEGAQQTIQILGRLPSGGGGSGTVTSVALSMPSAFSVTPSTITSSGTFAVSGAGTTLQYIRGNGTLATTDTGMIPDFYLKVRSLITGTSPITFSQITGAIGINNATASGTKGAATFNNSDFSDNGSGTISLSTLGSAGSCTGCVLNIDTKGRITGYSDGPGGATDNVNIGSGFRILNSATQEIRTLFAGFGQQIDSVANANGLTWSADTTRGSGLPTYFYVDSLVDANVLVNNGLSKDGDTIQFGQDVGAVGDPAALNNSRQIPLNGFNVAFTGTGSIGIGTSTPSASYKLTIVPTGSIGGINVTSGSSGTGVNASSTGNAIVGQSTGGSGTGVLGSTSTTGYGVRGVTGVGGIGGGFYTIAEGGDASPVVLELQRDPTGSGVTNGAGFTIMFRNGLTNGSTGNESGRITNYFSNAVLGTRTSAFGFHLMNNAVSARKALLAGDGQWTWDGYPALTQQTDTTNIKPIGYNTATGVVEPMANWMGGGGITDTVFSTYVAYVDTLGNDGAGVVNNPAKPFATIDAALIATSSLFICTIKIGMGAFDSPDSANLRSNILFEGSGMPVANDSVTVNAFYNNTIQAPTKLIGGTILRGSFIIPYNRENIHCKSFGVDVGSNWVTNFNSGVEVDGFLCAQLFNPAGGLPSADGKHQLQVNTKPRRGMLFKDIRVLLSSPTSAFHAFLIENTINPIADNIYTTYGFAGVVIKSIGGIYTNLHTRGHGTYHIILKSNDYSHCYGVVVNGFECGPSSGGANGIGVTMDQGDAGSPGIYWCNVSNGFINLTSGGLSLTGDNMNVSGINIVQGGSVLSSALIRSNVSNIVNRLSAGYGFDIDPGSVVATSGTTWNNCTAIGSALDGFYVHNGTARNEFESIISGENTGYGFNGNGAAYVGSHTYYTNTAGATLGTINVRNNSVTDGHTGNVSFTAYGIIAGGTTSTGALQQVSGTGTSGEVLTSNGAGLLPTWQAAGGATTIYNGDGTLTGNRTLTQGANTLTITGTGAMEILGNRALNIGTGASPLSSVNITSNGRLGLFTGITYGTDADNTDADYTVAANTIIAEITPNLTADRTLTLPTASVNGQTVTLVMRFSVDLDTYSLAAAVTDNATGTTFTQLDWGKTYDFMVDQSLAWRLIRKY